MKKSRFSVMALLAILFAVGSAFTAKVSMESKSVKQTSYYWYKVSTGAYQRFTTQSSESPMSGCNGTGIDCERGYDASQLNNPSQPSLGVKTSEQSHQKATLVKAP